MKKLFFILGATMLLSSQTFASEFSKSNDLVENSTIKNINVKVNLGDISTKTEEEIQSMLNEAMLPFLNNATYAQCTVTLAVEFSAGVISITGSVSVTADCRVAMQRCMYYVKVLQQEFNKQFAY